MGGTDPQGLSGRAQDPDGVRVIAGDPSKRRRTVFFQLLGLLFVGGCIGYAIMPASKTPSSPGGAPGRPGTPPTEDPGASAKADHAAAAAAATPGSAAAGTAVSAGSASRRSLTPRRLASRRPNQAPPESDDDSPFPLAPGDQPREISAGEYIQALHDAGIYEGIGAFNPPGTSPPLEGLAVPDDFPLPDGYVRHYQSTDDGQSIEPILMYSPDYEFFDANGNPVPIPEDRVVRPEDVPPGFPIRPIVIPPKREPGALGR